MYGLDSDVKMSWTLSIGVAAALLTLCGGQNTVNEENSLSPSGYHLCTHNETRTVSFLVVHEAPYSVSKPCGGWLLWKTCAVTIYRMSHQIEYKTVTDQVIRCCHGYVQDGRYCALPVNRSGEFSSKPGSCPTADGLDPRSEDCELDIDCPGFQKCCQRSGRSFCSDPAISANYSENGGARLNATVTVKIDYQQLMSKNEGLLNHTRLLQAMVTGALQSEVSVYYLSTWPVYPCTTATSLLIECSFTLSLFNVTSKLHLLLKRIEEVSSITVQDVDECAHSALRQCSLQADCNNTVGSYQCACHQGYIDVDPSNPGAHCSADFGVLTTVEPTLTNLPLTNTAIPPASSSTHGPHGNNTTDFFNPSETSMTAAPSNTTSVSYNSSPASLWTSSASYGQVNSTVESPLPVTTCSPLSISSLWSANVTGTSFSVCWSGWSQVNQTYLVVLSTSSEVIQIQETSDTMIEVSGLKPGLLYDVAVTSYACGNQGVALHIAVKTDAQTLQATTRLTNINFTADLQNSSSQAYKNLSEGIIQEIYQSLSPEMKAMVDSGQVKIEIRSFSPGSVVVDFSIVFVPSQNQDISNVSTALLHSLMNSVKYAVDKNSTSINDIDECASGENDCSEWATCNNTWGSFTCVCLLGFTDNNPERPGRACQAVATFETTTPALTTEITPSTNEPTVTTATAAPEITTDNTSKGQTSSTTVSTTAEATTTTTPTASSPAPPTTITTTTAVSTTSTTATMTIPTPPANITDPTATPAITTTAPRTATNSLNTTTSTNDSILGALSVHCRVAAITVTVTKNFLLNSKIQESSLYLGKVDCGVNGGNDTHVELTVAWDECDTKLVHNETHYIASVSLFNTMEPNNSQSGEAELPSKELKVPIMCAYRKSVLISTDFSVMGNEMIEVLMGSGSPQVTMQLMNGTVPLPQNYSFSRQLPVVVELRLNTSSDQIKLVINKCWATPTENPLDTSTYVFLQNSCPLNTYTKVLTNGNSSTSRVSVQIFSLVSLTVIYLHCDVQICLPTKSSTCVPDCLQKSARSVNALGRGFGSVGPLMSLDDPLDEKLSTLHVVGFSFLGIGLSLFFIGALACLLYCQRNRIGHYNFNVKPKEENFTYLVFNT